MPKRAMAEPERAIEGLYCIREGDVAGWLRKYPYLVPLLIEGREQARRIFGEGTELALELKADPDIRNYWLFFALILTDLDADEASDLLDRFDEEWWSQASYAAGNKLNFDVDFK